MLFTSQTLVNIHPSRQTNPLYWKSSCAWEMLITGYVVRVGGISLRVKPGKVVVSYILQMKMELSYTLACKYPDHAAAYVSHSLSFHDQLANVLPHCLLLSFLKNSAFTNSFQNPIHPFTAAIVFSTRT